jgi:ribose 5-phosphate isomerase B
MKVAVGADHGGFKLKKAVIDLLRKNDVAVRDFGTFTQARCDYPAIGYKVAKEVASKRFDRGILICKSGLGMTMVSNKVRGIRAALLHDIKSARSSREHNDANIAVFSGNSMGRDKAKKILKVWLNTAFAGGRHAKRVRQISRIEKIARGR